MKLLSYLFSAEACTFQCAAYSSAQYLDAAHFTEGNYISVSKMSGRLSTRTPETNAVLRESNQENNLFTMSIKRM